MPKSGSATEHDGSAPALRGIRVLSLAEQYPGPYATMILADLGADVVLVERPAGGDPSRRFVGHFQALNRGKRSIAVDLKTSAGAKVLWELIDTADVLIEGYRPGVMQRLGFGTEEVRGRRPELIYCSISAFGQTGPLSRNAGHDLLAQGMAGFVVGPDVPAPAPLPVADVSSAMFCVIGVLTALLSRHSGNGGSRIDVSMLDCLISWRSPAIVSALNGLEPAPYPPNDPGYGVFRTRDDKFITMSIAGEDHQWRALCEELGLLDLAGLSTVEREQASAAIRESLQATILRSDPVQLQSALAERGVALGPVNDDRAIAADHHVRARGLIVDAGSDADVRFVRQPIAFDRVAAPALARAPRLGEHTEDLLKELGCPPELTEQLIAANVAMTDGAEGR